MKVVGINTEAKTVQLRSSATMPYDYLILATGSTHSYFGHDAWEPFAPGLKTVEDAIEIRRRILLAFELAERQALEHGSHPPLNFVVIGGGPTRVELAGAISDISRLYMREDFRHIDPSKAHVIVVEGAPRILASYPEDLSRKATEELQGLGVEVRTGSQVTDVQPGYVIANGQRIESVVTLWAAGVQASPLGKMLGAETDKKGTIFVDPFLNPAGHPEIFVCGDLANVTENGHRIPGVAQPAMQMGTHAAKEILADLEGKPADAVSLLRQGRHGHHRTSQCRRGCEMAFPRAHERTARVDGVVDDPYLLPHRIPQSHHRVTALDVDVLRAFSRPAPDHRQPEIAGIGQAYWRRAQTGWTMA